MCIIMHLKAIVFIASSCFTKIKFIAIIIIIFKLELLIIKINIKIYKEY